MQSIQQMKLYPNSSLTSKNFREKTRKIMESDRLRRQKAAEKLRAEREELYNSVWFDRNYWIPIEKLDEFFTYPEFDIEYYSFENYKKRDMRQKEIADFGHNLYNQFIHNFLNSDNQLYYKSIVYLDNYTNRAMIRDVLDIMKDKFGSESFDPFTPADYENGVDDTRLYDKQIENDYIYDSEQDDDYYDSEA